VVEILGRCTPRRAARACPLFLLLLFACPAAARSIAFTFDDGPDMGEATVLDAAQRNEAILRQLSSAHLKSILFVTRTDADPARNALIREWEEQGHQIGNHTATHLSLDEVAVARFEEDFLRCDLAIRDLPGFTPRFRFPYLKEGDTREKRDDFRAFLDAHGYQIGEVSVDASDWYYNQRLIARLKRRPHADLAPYRTAYLAHLLDRARYYDGLSNAVLGRSVLHVLLLHHNLVNALFLGDVIRMFEERGFTPIDAQVAFADPVYALRPDIVPAGESILWALAKQRGFAGLRSPGEDDVYEKPILDRLHL
jgi:peptidoglycan/xylan/chitin deacetylase (PgdA/CDA1 family)